MAVRWLSAQLHAQAYRGKALLLHPDKRRTVAPEGPPQKRCSGASESLRGQRRCSTLVMLTRPGSRRVVAEREFNAMQKAYELLWCAAAQPLLCALAM